MNVIIYYYTSLGLGYIKLGNSNSPVQAVKTCLQFSIRRPNSLSNTNRFKLEIADKDFVLDVIYDLNKKYDNMIVISSPLFGSRTWKYYIGDDESINDFVDELFYIRALDANSYEHACTPKHETLASEMNKTAHDAVDNHDEHIYETLIERIKANASIGHYFIIAYPCELSERNVEKLKEEGFKVEPDICKISWEDEEA